MIAIGIVALIALPKARSLLPPAKLLLATAPSANVIGVDGVTVTVISTNSARVSRQRMALSQLQPQPMARPHGNRVMANMAGRRAIASMARDTAETGIRANAKTVDGDKGRGDRGGRDRDRGGRESGPSHRQYASSANPRERDRPIDPNSPFAKLAALREQMSANRKDP